MMQYVKQQHPDAKYVPSMMTDLGVKFKHKHHDNLHNLNENLDTIDYGVFEILIPIAYMDMKYYFQARPMDEIISGKVFIKKGSAGNKSISTRNIKVLKTFKYSEKNEMEAYLKELRSKAL
jgi:hypothetical protein